MTQRSCEKRLPLGEFVALVALMFSLVALSIDGMLPALPAIGADLTVSDPNDTQYIVSSLFLGLAFGQLLAGPLSDSFGRKPVIYAGLILFIIGCLLSVFASSFEWMIAGRVLQGFGAASPRIVTIALVRDQYQGREMARVMSFALSVFILVPALAPAIGQGILLMAGWRAIFVTFLFIALLAAVWFGLRQPETHPTERRSTLSLPRILAAAIEVCSIRAAIGHTVATGLLFASFVGYLSSAQQIFQQTYGVGKWFPAYFAALALSIGLAAVINGRLVIRYGMRRISTIAVRALTGVSLMSLLVVWWLNGLPPLWLFMSFFLVMFFFIGLLFGNLNALSMEPLGHIAGVGAAVVGFIGTLISVPIGAAIGQAYDGSVTPLAVGFLLFGAGALLTMRWAQTRDIHRS
ncbi:MAG: multidrug effflux MFS transporter [Gammaproteobacteria bacterium]|nr:multidrug effflux MFS transporter [Gammaproteobacteria bacterium]